MLQTATADFYSAENLQEYDLTAVERFCLSF